MSYHRNIRAIAFSIYFVCLFALLFHFIKKKIYEDWVTKPPCLQPFPIHISYVLSLNLPLSLLTEVVGRPTLLSTFTACYSYPDVLKYPSFKCDRGSERSG